MCICVVFSMHAVRRIGADRQVPLAVCGFHQNFCVTPNRRASKTRPLVLFMETLNI